MTNIGNFFTRTGPAWLKIYEGKQMVTLIRVDLISAVERLEDGGCTVRTVDGEYHRLTVSIDQLAAALEGQ